MPRKTIAMKLFNQSFTKRRSRDVKKIILEKKIVSLMEVITIDMINTKRPNLTKIGVVFIKSGQGIKCNYFSFLE